MSLQKWERVLLIAAAISLVIWGLAHTIGARSSSREAAVDRIARPGVAFWGEQVDVDVHIDANDLPTCGTPGDMEPIYVALVIDHSGSMAGSPLSEARNAASDFVQLMNLDKEGDAAAVIIFSDSASLLSDFSYDWGQVVRAIQNIAEGGGTDIASGLALASQRFTASPPPDNARRVLILLSDGQSDPTSAIAAADQAKSQGIRVVTIALGDADRETLARIASSDADYYETTDPGTLIEIYGEIAAGMVGVAATDVTMVENFNDTRFDLVNTTLYRAQQNGSQITWQLPFVGQRGRSVGYFLQPRSLGWHKVSPAPGQLSLTDCNGQALNQATPDGPHVLVLFPVWLLYIFPALALLWLLYRLIQAFRPRPHRTVERPPERRGRVTTGPRIEQSKPEPGKSPVTHGRPSTPKRPNR